MTALLLLAIGVHDLADALVPGRRGPRARRLTALACTAVAVLLGGLVLGAAQPHPAGLPLLGVVLVASGGALLWSLASRATPLASPAMVAGLALLAALEAAACPGGARFAPVGLVLLAAGVALVETANRVTRDVLTLAGRREGSAGPAAEGEHLPEVAGHAEGGGPGRTASELRGGRYIGPMERLLMAALGLAAAFPVIAAVMAAKGIVRFPEISADSGDGTRAEEFLVGSLTSGGLAAAAAFLAHAALHPW